MYSTLEIQSKISNYSIHFIENMNTIQTLIDQPNTITFIDRTIYYFSIIHFNSNVLKFYTGENIRMISFEYSYIKKTKYVVMNIETDDDNFRYGFSDDGIIGDIIDDLNKRTAIEYIGNDSNLNDSNFSISYGLQTQIKGSRICVTYIPSNIKNYTDNNKIECVCLSFFAASFI